MGIVKITAAQSFKIFGLMSLRSVLDWASVIRMKLSVCYLHNSIKLSREQLKLLQEDALKWVEHGLCTIDDCEALSLLPLNPLVHLKVSIDKVLRFTSDDLKRFGVTYQHMKNAGLHQDMLPLFHFAFNEWM